ncbi:MAG: fumarylacetoacetate hydrolase family protein [Alphaproteobacteria bacterium]|nr:fumarylacetoacetate hydrolase family protein [Alphaproteobacteria bacterium]
MRIVNFSKNGVPTLGVRKGRRLVDLSVAAPELPRDLKGLLAGGARALANAKAAADKAGTDAVVDEKKLGYLPPIQDPEKIICLGLNYLDHAKETNNPIPKYPVVFSRQATTLAGHGQPMRRPKVSKQFDYEAELAVIIGKEGRYIRKARALDHVAGYSCFNDGSLRDYQFKSSQFLMGKNFDASGGFGPEMVTPDELPKGASGLAISCKLNGKTVQKSSTDQHIFDVPTAIHLLSEVMTLEPGDVIVMGTPSGVGAARKPPLWMKPGDVCEIIIKGIGTLRNPIQAEK